MLFDNLIQLFKMYRNIKINYTYWLILVVLHIDVMQKSINLFEINLPSLSGSEFFS